MIAETQLKRPNQLSWNGTVQSTESFPFMWPVYPVCKEQLLLCDVTDKLLSWPCVTIIHPRMLENHKIHYHYYCTAVLSSSIVCIDWRLYLPVGSFMGWEKRAAFEGSLKTQQKRDNFNHAFLTIAWDRNGKTRAFCFVFLQPPNWNMRRGVFGWSKSATSSPDAIKSYILVFYLKLIMLCSPMMPFVDKTNTHGRQLP